MIVITDILKYFTGIWVSDSQSSTKTVDCNLNYHVRFNHVTFGSTDTE